MITALLLSLLLFERAGAQAPKQNQPIHLSGRWVDQLGVAFNDGQLRDRVSLGLRNESSIGRAGILSRETAKRPMTLRIS